MFSGALVLSPDLHSKNIHQSHLSQILNHNFKTTQLVTVPIDEVMRNLSFTKKPLSQKLTQCPREMEERNRPASDIQVREVSSALPTPTSAEPLVGDLWTLQPLQRRGQPQV